MHGVQLIYNQDLKFHIDKALSLPGSKIAEFGVSRDYGSSSHLFELSAVSNSEMLLVDPNKETLDQVKVKLGESRVKYFNEKGEDVGPEYLEGVTVAHLDGFDIVTAHKHKQSTIDAYQSIGIDLLKEGNYLSALSHFQITRNLLDGNDPASRMVIIFDDTWLERGLWMGKGATAIPYLLNKGFYCVTKPSAPCFQFKKYKWGVAFVR